MHIKGEKMSKMTQSEKVFQPFKLASTLSFKFAENYKWAWC